MSTRAFLLPLLLGAIGVLAAAAPEDGLDLDALTAGLAERLAESTVELPDGSAQRVMSAPAGAAQGVHDGLLDPARLRACLETVGRAESWPVAWLVVQEQGRDFDLVLRLALDEAGSVETPDFLFAVPRREWQPQDVRSVALEATGRKPPRKGLGNLVLQGFSKRVVTTYLYEAAPTGESAQGLAALLPPGSMLRESKAVSLEGEARHTLALVLVDAEFVPSDCSDCSSAVFGHADRGRIRLVLADDSAIVADLDLTEALGVDGGLPRLPRYRCDPSDGTAVPPIETFREREPVRLLVLTDLDGDGRALEVELPRESSDCERRAAVGVAIDPSTLRLRLRLLDDPGAVNGDRGR